MVSAFYIFKIKKDTESILKANYNSIEYSQKMLLSMDKIDSNSENALATFQTNLNKQLNNVTEIGEAEATNNVKNRFENLRINKSFNFLNKLDFLLRNC